MVLENYVVFEEGVPKRLHFTDHHLGDRDMPDPLIGITKRLTVLTMVVDQEDGYPVSKILSITANSLASQLAGYLPDRSYTRYDWEITRRGAGFSSRYTVIATPRAG